MVLQRMTRARRLANNYVRCLPDIEANGGKHQAALAAIYDDGALLYLTVDPTTEDSLFAAIQDHILERGRSDDGCVSVFVISDKHWHDALDVVSRLVRLGFTDNRQSDWHTIDQYLELIDRPFKKASGRP